ncbi:sulfotransferase [candidate division WOR-3 bacterium]|nr:sulfotransferase [candidate division WOR-3 bacterium]
MALPIFVIGKNRSGTKWLSNVIANHKDIACIQHELFGGILETNLITRMPRIFGDLSYDGNFIGFVECFSQISFFKLTGLNKDILYSKRPKNYSDFFRFLMDTYSEKEGKSFWVQKADTFALLELYNNFPDARFILIIRNIYGNISSSIGLKKLEIGKHYRANIPREMIKYFVAYKRINKFSRKDRTLLVRFEDLKDKRKDVVSKIGNFLNIPYDKNMLNDKFKKNTSFKMGVKREETLNKKGRWLIKILIPFFKIIPGFIYELIYKIKFAILGYNFTKKENPTFTPGAFTLLKHELGWGTENRNK